MGAHLSQLAVTVMTTAGLAACSTTAPEQHQGSAPVAAEPMTVEPPVVIQAAPAPHSNGQPRAASLSIPAIGVSELPVVPYPGRTDDARGTALQDRGVAASPHGPQGGAGPGGIGNYQVTAHRTSSSRAFADLPALRAGHRVLVEVGRVHYHYRVTATRRTSFRSARSLAEQRADVPGRPGVEPTRAFVTLSTCATPEDHAAGNFWADELSNPEHRIDKIGVLVRITRGAGGGG